MPIRVRVNSELGLVVVIFEGVVTANEIELELTPLVDDPRYSLMPLALFDTTAALRAEAPSELIRDGARRAEKAVDDQIEPGAKTALVAISDEFFGLLRMYQILRDGSPGEFEVFRSVSDAELWLGLPDDYLETLSDPT